jgi:hypothetical protein
VHLYELAARAVVVDDRFGLLVVRREPLVDRAGQVVRTALQLGALREPLSCQRVGQLQQQDDRKRLVDLIQQYVERRCLRGRARVAVEDESVLGFQELIADERNRDLVRDELAFGEQRLDLPSEPRAARDRGSIEIAGRNVRNLILRRDSLRLRSLARPLRSQDEDVYLRNPS